MPFVQVTWLPKACRRSPEVRKQVADAILKAMVSVKGAEIVCRILSARIYASRSVLIRLPLRRRRRTSSFALQRRWTDTRSRKARLKPLRLPHPGPAPHEKHCRWVRTYDMAMVASAISHISLTIG